MNNAAYWEKLFKDFCTTEMPKGSNLVACTTQCRWSSISDQNEVSSEENALGRVYFLRCNACSSDQPHECLQQLGDTLFRSDVVNWSANSSVVWVHIRRGLISYLGLLLLWGPCALPAGVMCLLKQFVHSTTITTSAPTQLDCFQFFFPQPTIDVWGNLDKVS